MDCNRMEILARRYFAAETILSAAAVQIDRLPSPYSWDTISL